MLYYIFRFLEQYDIPGAHLWSYISFRALLTLILSLLISAWFGEKFIKYLKRHNINETQRDASIDPFGTEKKGVPSMGGIIIIVSILVPVLLLGRMRNIYLILMIVTTVWLGLLGFADDYIKIFRKNKDGLHGIYKIAAQVGLGLFVGIVLWASPDAKINENISTMRQGQEIVVTHKSQAVKSIKTTIPETLKAPKIWALSNNSIWLHFSILRRLDNSLRLSSSSFSSFFISEICSL